MASSNVSKSVLLSIALTVLLVWLLMVWTGTRWSGIPDAFGRIELRWYLAALFVQLCVYPLRAARFRCLLNHRAWAQDQGRTPLMPLIPMAAGHSMFAYLLPAKVGDATLIWYLKSGLGVSMSRGLAVLLISRAIDLAFLTLALCGACWAVVLAESTPAPEKMRALAWVLLPLGLAMIWALLRGRQLVGWVRVRFGGWFRRAGGVGSKANHMLERLEEALSGVDAATLGRAAFWSLPIWAGVFLFYAFLVRGFGMADLSLAQASFGAGLAVVFGMLPISAFAGFGSQDAGWVLGFMAVGVGRVAATESGLAIHLVYAAHIVLIGFVGHAWARRSAVGLAAPASDTEGVTGG